MSACSALPIAGSAGRYMSMANGPIADSRPSTRARRRKWCFMEDAGGAAQYRERRRQCLLMTANLSTLADLRAGRLAGVTHLDLRHCGLDEFPREVFALADTLAMLDLSGNRLRTLPDDLPRLRVLRTLFCSNNLFETLPPSVGACPELDLVGFKANAIAHVPAEAL